jgi:hypothetical protein
VNPTGTGLVYSSYFSGTQTNTINFAAFTPNASYLGGSAGSADLPGFAGYPQMCLPKMYGTRLSPDAAEVGPSRVMPGKLLAYDAFAGTLIATTGTNVIAVDPNAAGLQMPPDILVHYAGGVDGDTCEDGEGKQKKEDIDDALTQYPVAPDGRNRKIY